MKEVSYQTQDILRSSEEVVKYLAQIGLLAIVLMLMLRGEAETWNPDVQISALQECIRIHYPQRLDDGPGFIIPAMEPECVDMFPERFITPEWVEVPAEFQAYTAKDRYLVFPQEGPICLGAAAATAIASQQDVIPTYPVLHSLYMHAQIPPDRFSDAVDRDDDGWNLTRYEDPHVESILSINIEQEHLELTGDPSDEEIIGITIEEIIARGGTPTLNIQPSPDTPGNPKHQITVIGAYRGVDQSMMLILLNTNRRDTRYSDRMNWIHVGEFIKILPVSQNLEIFRQGDRVVTSFYAGEEFSTMQSN